jgi:acyl-CoA synthetase (AMP-forming)/AMP-acid ligase II
MKYTDSAGPMARLSGIVSNAKDAPRVSDLMNPLVALFAASPVPRFNRIETYLDHWAQTTPHAEAAADSLRRLSYAGLQDEVGLLSRILMAKGVGRGDRVAMLDAPGCDFLALFLATVSIGGIWVGLNPRHSDNELSYVLEDAKPCIVFARSRIDGMDHTQTLNRQCGNNWVELDDAGLQGFAQQEEASTEALSLRQHELGADDPALLVYTSGSTGRPKGAQLHHRGITHAAWAHATVWYVSPMRTLNNLPINHVGGVCDIGCTVLVAGGFQVFMERFDAERSLATIQTEKLTMWGQVPTQLRLSLAVAGFDRYDLLSLKIIIWSGARASIELIEQLYSICSNLSCSYGMTETIGSVTMHPVGSKPEVLDGSIGWADPERGVRVSDSGEVEVRDAFMMHGYLNRPDASMAWTQDGWFRTGDLATQRTDGSFTLIGRASEMYKSGGYNVYPREVEAALEALPEVGTAVVTGTTDDLWDEVGVAFVLASHECALDLTLLNTKLRHVLANYKLPKRYVEVEEMPMLAIGKIDRAALKRRAAESLN